jgi:outer membrane protein assembly factor BamD
MELNRSAFGSRQSVVILFFFFLPVLGLFFACASAPKPYYTDDYLRNTAEEEIENKKYDKARHNLEELEKLYPDSPHIADVRLTYADTYFKEDQYVDAIVQYQRFLDFHPRNKLADQAQYRMAMSYLNQIPNYERDQTFTEKALETFELLLRKYPDSPLTAESKAKINILNTQLAENIFSIGEFYYRAESYEASIKRFRRILLEYPQITELAEKSMMFLAHSYLSQGSVEEAKVFYRLFLGRFPQSIYADDVQDYLER